MSEMKGIVSSRGGLILGAFFTLLSFFSAASTNALVKLIKDAFPVAQILFCQNFFGLILLSLFCLFYKKRASFFRSHQFGLLFLRSMTGLCSFFLLFTAVHHLSVSITTLLLNTAPLFVPFLLLFFFKEKLKAPIWLGILPGFLGIVLILKPDSDWIDGYALLALLSGVCAATILIVLRRLHLHNEPMLRILFYLFLFSTIAVAPFSLQSWKNPFVAEGWLLLLTLCSSFFAQTSITIAMRYGSPKAFAPLCYTSVLFGLLFDWFVFHAIPPLLSCIGMALVILGGAMAILIENREMRKRNS
jgi:drug/metabolite transporter (DMT)-like permease